MFFCGSAADHDAFPLATPFPTPIPDSIPLKTLAPSHHPIPYHNTPIVYPPPHCHCFPPFTLIILPPPAPLHNLFLFLSKILASLTLTADSKVSYSAVLGILHNPHFLSFVSQTLPSFPISSLISAPQSTPPCSPREAKTCWSSLC